MRSHSPVMGLIPLVRSISSPGMTISCKSSEVTTGSPLIDGKGWVRAVVSRGLSEKIKDYVNNSGLLIGKLKNIYHSTNLACAPTIFDTEVLDEKECSKDLTYTLIDRFRSEMLLPANYFAPKIEAFKESMDKLTRYIKFSIELKK